MANYTTTQNFTIFDAKILNIIKPKKILYILKSKYINYLLSSN